MKLRKEIIQLAFCSITLLGIVHFLTRPKVYTDTEYITVTDIEYIDREVEKIVEIPITVTDTVYEYIDADGLTFDIVFKIGGCDIASSEILHPFTCFGNPSVITFLFT